MLSGRAARDYEEWQLRLRRKRTLHGFEDWRKRTLHDFEDWCRRWMARMARIPHWRKTRTWARLRAFLHEILRAIRARLPGLLGRQQTAGKENSEMKAVILAGGMGTRIFWKRRLVRPKPMIEIGGRPILWHIMKLYAHHGIYGFFDLPRLPEVLMIKEYFT